MPKTMRAQIQGLRIGAPFISHDAASSVKRLCRQQGKAFVPLRSSGTSSLLVAPGKEAPLCRVENAPSAR